MEPIDDSERMQFVPWENLPRSVSRQPVGLFMAAAGVVVVLAVGLIWTVARGGADTPELPSVVSVASETVVDQAPSTTPPPPPSSESDTVGLSEADLRADAAIGDRQIEAAVVEFVQAYFGSSDAALHPFGPSETGLYVDWMTVVEVVGIGTEQWESEVTVALVELAPEPRRLAPQRYRLSVARQGMDLVFGLPERVVADGAVTVDSHEQDWLPVDALPTDVAATAGSYEAKPLGGWEAADGWRLVVTGPGGLPVVVRP